MKKFFFFPESYRQPYQIEKTTNANIQERTEVLNFPSKEKFHGIIVTYPQSLCEKVTLKQKLNQNTLQIRKGEKLSTDFISEFLKISIKFLEGSPEIDSIARRG